MAFKIKVSRKIRVSTTLAVVSVLLVLLTYSFAFSSYVKLLFVGITAIYFLRKNLNFRVCPKNIYIICYILFGVWGTLSFLWASYSEGVRAQEYNMWGALLINIILVIFIVHYNQNFDSILRWMFPVMMIYLGQALLVGSFNEEGRFSTSGAVNQFGISTGYVFLIALYAAKKQKISRKWSYLLIGMSAILTILTGSRKALVNLALFTCMVFFFEKYDKNVVKNMGKLLGIIAIAVIFIFVVMNIRPVYDVIGKRFVTLLAYFKGDVRADLSALRRSYMKQDAIKIFLQNPIRGIGLNNFKYVARYGTYAHSDIYEILCCLGIVGEILYFVPLVLTFIMSFFQWKKNYANAVIPFAIFLSVLINETSNVSYIYGMLHVFWGISAGLLFVKQK